MNHHTKPSGFEKVRERATERALELLSDGVPHDISEINRHIRENHNYPQANASGTLRRLCRDGFVQRNEDGRWQIK